MSNVIRRFVSIASVGLAFAIGASAATTPGVNVRPQARVLSKVDSKQLTVLAHSTPAVVAASSDAGHLPTDTPLNHMLLVLRSSDEQEYALHSLIDQQQDKSSPNYHSWMTPEAFNAAFGVASSDVASVRNWLQDSGFSVEKVSAGGRVVEFSGTSGQVEAAFHTELHNVTVNGQTHFTNTVDLSVPSAIAPVISGISKLNNFPRKANAINPRKLVKGTDGQFYPAMSGTDAPDYTSVSTGKHYVGPADLTNIYNGATVQNAGINGKGVTIGIIGQSSINISDAQAYRALFRLPNNDPQIINVGPAPSTITDDFESYLDVELAGALATQSKILFYTAGLAAYYDIGVDVSSLEAVDANVADIISLSYGGCEASNGSGGTAYWNSLWEQAAAQGQTVFVSTGDSSATGCVSSSAATASSNPNYAVNALGSSAYNVAVGGTMFFEDLSATEAANTGTTKYWGPGGIAPYGTALSYIPEAVWNESTFDIVVPGGGGGIVGAGGGVSIFTARPSWQVGPGISTTDPAGPTFTTTGAIPATQLHRLVPDVSFIAASGHDATVVCAEGSCKLDASGNATGIGAVGGTSVATPAMASVQALINQMNGGRQGNANYFYYKLAAAQKTANCASTSATSTAGCNFNDVVTGNNYAPTTTKGSYSNGTYNGTFGTDYIGFAAGTGFDVASGLGSPNISNLATNWKTVTFNSTTTKLTLSPTTTTHGTAMSATVNVSASAGTPTGDVSITAVGQTPAGPGDGNVYTLSGGSVSMTLMSLPGGTYNVVAHYSGDSVYGASDSAPIQVTISKENSTTFLTPGSISTSTGGLSHPTTYTYGLSVYLEADVEGNSATAVNNNNVLNTGVPTGAVTFALSNGGTALTPSTQNLDAYGTTYLEIGPAFGSYLLASNYPSLPPATYAATASYPGDNSFNASNASATFTVVKATVRPTLTVTSAEIASGATASFRVSIAASGAGVLPTGTVTLTDNTTATVLGTGTLANGLVTFTTTNIKTNGAHSIVATYGGDGNYNTAASTAGTVTVGGTATSITLTASLSAAKVLNYITFTATVPTGVTGTVYFYDGAAVLGSATISTTSLTAVLTTNILTAGSHSVTATYAGTATYQSATSAAVSVAVAQNTPSLSLTSQLANSTGSSVGLTAQLNLSPSNVNATGTTTIAANPAPTALVQFMDGTKVLGTASLGYTLNYHTYVAVYNSTALGPGPHALTAMFLGDTNYAAATSNAQNISVGATTTTISTSTTNVGTNYPFTVSATVTPQLASTVAVTGTVTFYDGANKLGTATVVNGTATLTTATLTTVGTHSITAVYSGDSNYAPSTSATPVSVVAVKPGFGLVANPADLNVPRGQSVMTTITATPFGNYTGSLSFSCTGVPAGAKCSFTPASLSFNGTNASASTVFAVSTTAPNATKTLASSFLWLPAMLLAGVFAVRRKQFTKRGYQLMMLAIALFGMAAMTGCGSGGTNGTPRGVTTLTVTASGTGSGPGSGNVTQTINVNLYVE